MKKVVLIIIIGIFLIACSTNKLFKDNKEHTIVLKWNKAYKSETKEKVNIGLLWSLSYLGADLTIDNYQKGIKWQNEELIFLDVMELGYNKQALEAWDVILNKMKSSHEYKIRNYLDLGKFIMLTFNSSNHYYKITNTPDDINKFLNKSTFLKDSVILSKDESMIAKADRLIFLNDLENDTSFVNIEYLAIEGYYDSLHHNFKKHEFEILDIMNNGQIRMAIYNNYGKLKDAANPMLSIAGKPSKCIWCHERGIQPLFKNILDYENRLSLKEVQKNIKKSNQKLKILRKKKNTSIDYNQRHDHTEMELLYINFQEPSAMRIAAELDLPLKDVLFKLSSITTHRHQEFDFLGDLYFRKDVEFLFPYETLETPVSAREFSKNEPNYFK